MEPVTYPFVMINIGSLYHLMFIICSWHIKENLKVEIFAAQAALSVVNSVSYP